MQQTKHSSNVFSTLWGNTNPIGDIGVRVQQWIDVQRQDEPFQELFADDLVKWANVQAQHVVQVVEVVQVFSNEVGEAVLTVVAVYRV